MVKTQERNGSRAAKLLYRPFGLAGSVVGGALAGLVFKQIWKRATPGENADAPGALESEHGLREILVAAALQGALFALVKALIDRGMANVFAKFIGDWPGD
ncbi:DUF4235 domain-containing protein [Brevibacterium casei]|uniref:DUF4235 domain-containing protein n=1 Tax=Brevibacterium casei CIP 102111 TaxID=1255625 RepID=A0A2H1KMN4_9MICO|nr:DUF4235 domain-containing protein [Brevibacterium casei]SIK47611.1 integral membrane protein [Mycobacteroides abscessus subsp. abscessus]MBE4696318.1 DUF4235 domain-containing protein [Brevibacterium casei]MBY3579440.1 DUF4235 domain-containing protein [Brevibacterium casei]QPR40233.1 DUF4235 domain-containing protein [Brevibacterium casei]QPR44389.1 DUF4235 domain-containing protein [Brevibacterium casei]